MPPAPLTSSRDRTLRLAVLLALNAVSVPYANLVHDAQLYALQVLNRVHDGAFTSDLFLKYGSQDQYTPFSWLVAPLARVVDVEWTFFLLFLMSSALVIVALDVLIRALIADRLWATATTMFAAISSMPYGGLSVFFVREGFFTPRMPATALAIFALGCALRGHHGTSVVLAALATLIHPLMGAPALVVVTGVAVSRRVSPHTGMILLVVAGVTGAVVVVAPPLGFAVFGAMDADWLALVRHASPYAVLEGWKAADWARGFTALVTVVGAGALMRKHDFGAAAIFLGSAVTACAGLAASAIASDLGYRLLMQSQPYRAVWLLQLLHIPAAVIVASALWQRGGPSRVAAAGALSTLVFVDFVVYELLFVAFVLALCAFADARVRSGRSPAMVAGALGLSVLAGTALWGAVKMGFAIQRASDIMKVAGVSLYVKTILGCVPRVVWFAALVIAVAWALRRLPARTLLATALGVAILPHVVTFALHAVPALRNWTEPHARDVAFVRGFIAARYPPVGRPPTVYAGPWGDLGLVWLGLRAQNYFAAVVVIFNRETAFETLRRARLVRLFELERYRDIGDMVPPVAHPLVAYLFEPQRPAPSPGRADLARLCEGREAVDIAVLAQDLGGLASADNGRVFIYECRRLRGVARGAPRSAGTLEHL